ncbi:hypothetical protein BD289DRAFT_21626 [Coniella lustricola]|uniref:Uncharacterized protein n=1 Tax=Coniella lustricola TaxID=2025994 RepID=A0A2T3A3J5_9PEZI|nr:hypothetical protein BD289DRAFT_21626 [Coniella lustricola]
MDLPGSAPSYAYSVHHAQSSAGLVSPTQVQNVFLSKVVCEMTFAPREILQPRAARETMKKHNRSRIITMQLPRHRLRQITGGSASRRRSDRLRNRSKKNGDVTEQGLSQKSPMILKDDSGMYNLASGLRNSRIEHLTHIAINLVLGYRKRFMEIKSDRRLDSPTLLDIAPAVWNAYYFQEIASRTRLVPMVSSALGSMRVSNPDQVEQSICYTIPDATARLQKRLLQLILRSTSLRFRKFGKRSDASKDVHPRDTLAHTIAERTSEMFESLCSSQDAATSQQPSVIDINQVDDLLEGPNLWHEKSDSSQSQDERQAPFAMDQYDERAPHSEDSSEEIRYATMDRLNDESEEQYHFAMHGHDTEGLTAISPDTEFEDFEHSNVIDSVAMSFGTLPPRCISEGTCFNIWTSLGCPSINCHGTEYPDDMYLEAEEERAMLLDSELF